MSKPRKWRGMKNETQWAIRNLELAGWFDKDSLYGSMLGDAVKRLLEAHEKEEHSGMSHGLAVNLFKAVALDEPLTMEYWQEKFDAYNEFAKKEEMNPWTEESFENIVMKKPVKKSK